MGLFDKQKIKQFIEDENQETNIDIRETVEKTKNGIIEMFNGSKGQEKVRIPYNCVGFIGNSGGVGVTTICWEIANIFAENKYSVVIVDLNLTKPSMCSKYLSKRISKNLRVYLEGGCELGDMIVKNDGIDFVETIPYNFNELCTCDDKQHFENMREMIELLKKVYDVVLIDFGNSDLLFFDMIQGALKEVTNLVCISNDSTSSYLNRENVLNSILFTKEINPINVINNHDDALRLEAEFDVVLPTDLNMRVMDMMGKCYLKDGNSQYEDLANGYIDLYNKMLEEMGVESDIK